MVDPYLKEYFPNEPLDKDPDKQPEERNYQMPGFTISYITEIGTGRKTKAYVRGDEQLVVWTRSYCQNKLMKIFSGETTEEAVEKVINDFQDKHINNGQDEMRKAWANDCIKVFSEVWAKMQENPPTDIVQQAPPAEPEKPKPKFNFAPVKKPEPEKAKLTFRKPAP